MRHLLNVAIVAIVALVTLLCLPAFGQRREPDRAGPEVPANSPSKLLRHQHDEVKKMAAKLTEMATEVEEDLDKIGENVLPLNTLKKLDEIEKLARKMRDRLKQ